MAIKEFPYIDTDNNKVGSNKMKFPCKIKSQDTRDWYQQNGHEVIEITDLKASKRFDTATITLKKPEKDGGKTYKNTITLSPPTSGGIGLRKQDGEWQMCLLLQPRSPYTVEVNGKTYTRFFYEMVGGIAEPGETLEETAIREIEEETGYKVKAIHKLIEPKMHRHVSYTDETSIMFYSILSEPIGQALDYEEDIKVKWYSISDVETEFEDYLDGRKETFFGFDPAAIFVLALQRFFTKYHRGQIQFE